MIKTLSTHDEEKTLTVSQDIVIRMRELLVVERNPGFAVVVQTLPYIGVVYAEILDQAGAKPDMESCRIGYGANHAAIVVLGEVVPDSVGAAIIAHDEEGPFFEVGKLLLLVHTCAFPTTIRGLPMN